ncbi:hypothetical protein RQP46_010998 [Phenoliferia psychrophenolica]
MTLSALPNELKGRIVQLVVWQEEAYNKRADDMPGNVSAASRKIHVNAIFVISLLNKILTPNLAILPIFRHIIFRKHGHRFRRASLEMSPLDKKPYALADLDQTLAILPSLINLRSLVLDAKAARGLFGEDLDLATEQEDDVALRIATFKELARQVDDLHLSFFIANEVEVVLALCPPLRRLCLEAYYFLGEEDPEAQLLASLKRFKDLKHLEVDFYGIKSGQGPWIGQGPWPKWTSAQTEQLQSNPPPISTLHFTTVAFPENGYNFISAFGGSLAELHLSLSEYINPSTLPAPLSLPHLTTLHLRLTKGSTPRVSSPLSSLLSAFSSAPLISLSIIDERCANDLSIDSAITLLKDRFPTLCHLSILPEEPSAKNYSHVATYLSKRGLPPPPVSTPFEDNDFTWEIEDGENGMICDALDGVLDFGKLEVARLRAGGNVAELVKVLESLRPLDEHRRTWLD